MSDIDYNDDLEQITHQVGFLHPSQRSQVIDAIDEDRDGVLHLAAKCSASSVHAPAAAFMTMLKQGQHIQQQAKPARVAPALALRRLYDAKLSQLTDFGWGSMQERQREAIDYACSEVHRCNTGPFPPGGICQLENELYASIGIERVPSSK